MEARWERSPRKRNMFMAGAWRVLAEDGDRSSRARRAARRGLRTTPGVARRRLLLYRRRRPLLYRRRRPSLHPQPSCKWRAGRKHARAQLTHPRSPPAIVSPEIERLSLHNKIPLAARLYGLPVLCKPSAVRARPCSPPQRSIPSSTTPTTTSTTSGSSPRNGHSSSPSSSAQAMPSASSSPPGAAA